LNVKLLVHHVTSRL